MEWIYLLLLIFSLIGLFLIDWRNKLAFFADTRRTFITLVIGILFFLVWDVAGVALGIFFSGGSPYSLPFMVLPEVPIEEFFFLFLLCYLTLLIYRGCENGFRHIR